LRSGINERACVLRDKRRPRTSKLVGLLGEPFTLLKIVSFMPQTENWVGRELTQRASVYL
jgi:hypothetical protein